MKKPPIPTAGGWEIFHDRLSCAEAEIVREFESGLYERQPWPVAPAGMVKRLWKSYAELGHVIDEKSIDKVADIVVRNIVRLDINNRLSGHADFVRPETYIDESLGVDPGDAERLIDWAIDTPEGGWRISDYAPRFLLPIAACLLEAESPEEKLVLVDAALNVAHQRSDLSAWFIEGGRNTLSEMFLDGTPEGRERQPCCAEMSL